MNMRGISFVLLFCALPLFFSGRATGQSIGESVSAAESESTSSVSDSNVSSSVPSAPMEESNVAHPISQSTARLIAMPTTMRREQPKNFKSPALNRFIARRPLVPRRSAEAASPKMEAARLPGKEGLKTRQVGGGDSAVPEGVFPDSTRGTGFPNPPDSGSASPFDWRPNLKFGFSDFAQEIFLNPTFDVRGHSVGSSSSSRTNPHRRRNSNLRHGPSSTLTVHPKDGLASQSVVDSSLHTSIDQRQ